MSSEAEWVIGIVEDFEIPGWFLIPQVSEDGIGRAWVEECAQALSAVVGEERWDGEIATEVDVRELLGWALEERAATDSDALFQVWPVPYPAALMCHLNLVASATLPSWTELGVVTHPIEAPHLGPGIQCSTRRAEGEGEIDLVSVHLVFDNGDVALMMSLEEAPSPLITRALPEFMFLMEALNVERSDGAPFHAVAPDVQFDEPAWPFEESR